MTTPSQILYSQGHGILADALSRPSTDREEYVSERCNDRPELRRFLLSLLREDIDRPLPPDTILNESVLLPSDDSDELPATIGPFSVISKIGSGGMGIVFAARQNDPERIVALKVMRRWLETPDRRDRFRAEASALARLQHPGIVQIYSADTIHTKAEVVPYFVMEFVPGADDESSPGPTLRQYALEKSRQRQEGWAMRERLEMIAKVCDAVEYAHLRGIIHRDLKPENILIAPSGEPKVVDFGLVKIAPRDEGEVIHQATKATVGGTAVYMSPEQAAGDPVDHLTDVYSLGIVAYELCSGQLPFATENMTMSEQIEVLKRHDPRPLRHVDRSLGGDVEIIVSRAIRRDPRERYQSARDLSEDIRRYLRFEPINARRQTLVYRVHRFVRRRPAVTSTVVAIVLGILITVRFAVAATREAASARDVESVLEEGLHQTGPIGLGSSPPSVLGILDSIAMAMAAREHLMPQARFRLHTLMGSLNHEWRRHDQTLAHYREAAGIAQQNFGRTDARTLQARGNYAMASNASGDANFALTQIDDLLSFSEDNSLSDPIARLVRRGNRAVALFRLARYEEAIAEFSSVADELFAEGDRFYFVIATVWNARAILEAGNPDIAESMLADLIAAAETKGPGFRTILVAAMQVRCEALLEQERWSDARRQLLDMLDTLERFADPASNLWFYTLKGLAKVHYKLGDHSTSIDYMQRVQVWHLRYGTNMLQALKDTARYLKSCLAINEENPDPEYLLWFLAECDSIIFDNESIERPRRKECIVLRMLATFMMPVFLGPDHPDVKGTLPTSMSLIVEVFGEEALRELYDAPASQQKSRTFDEVVNQIVSRLNHMYATYGGY